MSALREMRDFLGFYAPVFPILALFLGFIYWGASTECSTYSEMTGRDTEFKIIGGCYVRHGDRFIPQDEYKYIEVKQESVQ